MSNEREILEKLIADGKEAESKLAELEVTYSIGDRFRLERKILLAQLPHGEAGMIELDTGRLWGGHHAKIKDLERITEDELANIHNSAYTLYWDFQSKIYTGKKKV